MPELKQDNDPEQKERISPWVQVIPQLPKVAGILILCFFGYLSVKELAGTKTELDINADIDISTNTNFFDVMAKGLSNQSVAWSLIIAALLICFVYALKQRSLRKKESLLLGNRHNRKSTTYSDDKQNENASQEIHNKEDRAE